MRVRFSSACRGQSPLSRKDSASGGKSERVQAWRGEMGISTKGTQRTRREGKDPPQNPGRSTPEQFGGQSAEAGPVVGDEDRVGGIGGPRPHPAGPPAH